MLSASDASIRFYRGEVTLIPTEVNARRKLSRSPNFRYTKDRKEKEMADKMLDVTRLNKITEEMIAAITSPPFVEAMRMLKATPQDQRLKVGAEILTPKALQARGVPLPTHMRLTSRYFESGKPSSEADDSLVRLVYRDDGGGNGGSSGGCCCGGGATFCGGCGG
jgi:hypothetical protein